MTDSTTRAPAWTRPAAPCIHGTRPCGHAGRAIDHLVVNYWLKAIGHARGPLSERWLDERPELLHRTGFPRRPRIATGDRLVLYASVWRRVFAICEVIGDPEPRDHPRWPWTVAIETLLVVPVLDAAPPVEAIGVAARSMSQQSHISIRREHYERAVEAIASIAA